jgi:hypothetical protein
LAEFAIGQPQRRGGRIDDGLPHGFSLGLLGVSEPLGSQFPDNFIALTHSARVRHPKDLGLLQLPHVVIEAIRRPTQFLGKLANRQWPMRLKHSHNLNPHRRRQDPQLVHVRRADAFGWLVAHEHIIGVLLKTSTIIQQ